jgi:hypothetical protein
MKTRFTRLAVGSALLAVCVAMSSDAPTADRPGERVAVAQIAEDFRVWEADARRLAVTFADWPETARFFAARAEAFRQAAEHAEAAISTR